MEKKPRVTLICLFYWENKILVYENYDKESDEMFYRCIGGGLDFGESLEKGLRREVLEEIGYGIEQIVPIGVANEVKDWKGKRHHAVYLIYDARFSERTAYTTEPFMINDNGKDIPAQWIPLEEFRSGEKVLHPFGLMSYLDRYMKKPPRFNWMV